MLHVERLDALVWRVSIDKKTWEDAAAAALEMRAPCPLPGHETRLACIVPRNRAGKGGRRCQLQLRLRLSNEQMRLDTVDQVEALLAPWDYYTEEDKPSRVGLD